MPEKKRTTTYNSFTLDTNNLPQLTAQEAAQLDAASIDYSDIPEIPAGFWAHHRLDRENKAQITLRLDQEVLDFFKKGGKRYQSRINAVLRAYVDAHR